MSTFRARCLCGPRVGAFRVQPARVGETRDAKPRSSRRADPTGTGLIRRRWMSDLNRRWHALRRMIPDAISARVSPVSMISHTMLTGQDPIRAFQGWLDEAMRQIVLGVNGSWILPYVRRASDAGALHARSAVPSGSRLPPVADRTNLLQSVTIAELQGIVEATSQQAVRVFADGIMARRSLTAISREVRTVVDKVGVHRGHLLVNFMTVRAFNAATLDGYRARGIYQVGTIPELAPRRRVRDAEEDLVEVLTAGDNDVCPECEDISDNGPYGLDEAEGLIPAHPNCRCAFVPFGDERFASVRDAFDPNQPRDKYGKWTDIELKTEHDKVQRQAQNRSLSNQKFSALIRRRQEIAGELHRRQMERHTKSPEKNAHGLTAKEVSQMQTWGEIPESNYAPAYERLRGSASFGRAIEKLPEYTGTVYRGLSEKDPSYRVGQTVNVERHSAAATGQRTASAYAIEGDHRPVVYKIEGGTFPDFSKSGFSSQSEGEVIVPRGTRLRVTHVEIRGNVTHVTLSHQRRPVRDSETHVASGIMIVAENTGRILFLRRSRSATDHPGEWAFPAGAVEAGETIEEAAARETREETGMDIPVENLVQLDRQDFDGVDFTTYVAAVDLEFTPALNNEHDAYRWARVEAAPSPLHPGVLRTLRVALGDADWKEEEHPRDPSGKFTESGVEKQLPSVLGTSSERVAMRAQMKGLMYNDPMLKTLQERHNASLLKQYQKLTKKDDTEKANAIGAKLAKYSKSYGLKNPLATPKAPPVQLVAPHPPPSGPTPTPDPLSPEELKKKHGENIFATPALDFASLKKDGEKKGSNPGGIYEDKDGQRYYVKSMDEAHARNELLAARLYALTGARTLDYVPVKPSPDGTHHVATRYVELDKNNVSQLSPSERAQAQRDLATHAWLANWDAAGTGGDNQGVKGGITKTLDVGGSLEYRAKGAPKGAAFGNKVDEIDTLRMSPSNPDSVKLFGDMTNQKIRESISRVTAIPDNQIYATVKAGGGTMDLANKLIDRKNDLLKRGDNLTPTSILPKETHPDFSTMSDEQERVYWLKKTVGTSSSTFLNNAANLIQKHKLTDLEPSEVAFIQAFTGPHSKVNENLRNGIMNEHEFAYKHIMNDALAKMPPYTGDTVYRKINLSDNNKNMYEPGKVVHWAQFSSTSKKEGTWSGNTHFTIHNPKSGVDVQKLSFHPNEAEVIMPADTYYRVLSKKQGFGGVTLIELEEVLPPGKKKKYAA